MTIENIGIFKGMTAKMGYLSHRQSIISQNVANADTPGYKPQDLTPVDFSVVLDKATDKTPLRPTTTQAGHFPNTDRVRNPDERGQRLAYEVAPAGNAVIMEEQMIKASQTTMDYNMMTTLYQKNVNMIRMALGT